MAEIDNLVRKNVRTLTPYSCARDEFSGTDGIFLDANENPFGDLNRYPDPYQKELKEAVCKLKGVSEENLFLGNGSDEVIDLTYRIFCNPGRDKVLIFPPTYGMYEVSASVNDVETVKIPLKENFQIDLVSTRKWLKKENLKLVFICSPNNPTANCMDETDMEFVIKNFNGIVIIDEAYIDFSKKTSFLKLINKYNNLIVMQTFSKAWGLASVRIGMAFSNPDIIRYFNKVKPPYNISSGNQRTVLAKLGKIEDFKKQVNEIVTERERVTDILKNMDIIVQVYPSEANFLLVKVIDANLIYKTLMVQGIIIRNRTRVIKECVRITIGTKKENDALINALKRIIV
jgi:histidinol-phosphate aminotransferase